jgi:hypothetical protein
MAISISRQVDNFLHSNPSSKPPPLLLHLDPPILEIYLFGRVHNKTYPTSHLIMSSLPTTHHALVLTDKSNPLAVKEVPTPAPTHGSAVVEILSAGVLSYHREIYAGAESHRHYSLPTPLVTGMSGKSPLSVLPTLAHVDGNRNRPHRRART